MGPMRLNEDIHHSTLQCLGNISLNKLQKITLYFHSHFNLIIKLYVTFGSINHQGNKKILKILIFLYSIIT